jgi:hypothetical protein
MVHLQPKSPRLTLALLSLCLAAPCALAQNDRALTRVDWGLGGAVAAGHWTPLRVWLAGGSTARSGILSVEYRQDSTQSARILTQASTTPGKLVPVELYVNLPAQPGDITIRFESDGQSPETALFSDLGSPDSSPRPPIFAGTRSFVASVAVPSLNRALPSLKQVADQPLPVVDGVPLSGFAGIPREALSILRWSQLAAAPIEPDALPTAPFGYSAAEALVLRADALALADARAIDAIREWTLSGGRLVVLADDAGAWRSLLPPSPDLLSLAPTAELATPSEISDLLARSGRTISNNSPAAGSNSIEPRWNSWVLRDAPANISLSDSPESFAAKSSIKARLISLSPDAQRLGWSILWSTSPNQGLIAHGPVGLGWLTVLGVDPEQPLAGLDNAGVRRLWHAALSPSLAHYLNRPLSDRPHSDDAVSKSINASISVPQLGDWIFHSILIGTAVLAVLVGPVDWFLCRRRGAPSSRWLLPLAWIGLASIIGAVIPPTLRAGPSLIDRALLLDIVQSDPSLNAQARAWQTGVTGVFANRRLQISPDPSATAAWWYGTAASPSDDMPSFGTPERFTPAFEPLLIPQPSTPTGRLSVPLPTNHAIWTYRNLIDAGHATSTVRARLKSSPSGDPQIELVNVPKDAVIENATLIRLSGATPITFSQPEGATARRIGRPDTSAPAIDQRTPIDVWVAGGPMGLLPASAGRTSTLADLVRSGRWAVLILPVRADLPGTAQFVPPSLPDASRSTSTTIRIALPIDPSPQESTQ